MSGQPEGPSREGHDQPSQRGEQRPVEHFFRKANKHLDVSRFNPLWTTACSNLAGGSHRAAAPVQGGEPVPLRSSIPSPKDRSGSPTLLLLGSLAAAALLSGTHGPSSTARSSARSFAALPGSRISTTREPAWDWEWEHATQR